MIISVNIINLINIAAKSIKQSKINLQIKCEGNFDTFSQKPGENLNSWTNHDLKLDNNSILIDSNTSKNESTNHDHWNQPRPKFNNVLSTKSIKL